MLHFFFSPSAPPPPSTTTCVTPYLHIYPCFFYWRPPGIWSLFTKHLRPSILTNESAPERRLTVSLTHSPPLQTRGEPLPADIVQFKPDVILAAECVYFEPAFPLLLQTLKDLLALCPSATVYFCFKKRRRADMQFVKRAKKAFVLTEVADDERPVFSREGLFLYTITTKTRPSGAAS